MYSRNKKKFRRRVYTCSKFKGSEFGSHSSVWKYFLSRFLLVSILSYITGTPPDICTVEIKRKIIEYLVLRKPNMKESEYTTLCRTESIQRELG